MVPSELGWPLPVSMFSVERHSECDAKFSTSRSCSSSPSLCQARASCARTRKAIIAHISELGIATHYVHPNSIPDIVRQISEHSAPTLSNLSSLVASYSPPLPSESTAPSSKKSPDGHTPITGEIRTFLDYAFSHDSLSQIYKVVKESAENEQLSAELRQWAGEQKAILDAKSPSGMAVALESYKRAKAAKRLDNTLLNDMAMATAFSVSHGSA
jgi:hypothetical protein